MVRTASFSIVHRSNFANHDVKYGALIREYKKAQEMDQRILKPLLTDTSVKSPYCHVTCAFRNEKNNAANDLDEEVYNEKSMTLSSPKRKTINSYLRNIGVTMSNYEEGRYDDCTRCYQRGVQCKKNADEDMDPPGPKYNGRTDGICKTKTLSRKDRKCATIADYYAIKDEHIITIYAEDHGEKQYRDVDRMWEYGRFINNIIPEKNCYVKVYEDRNYEGDAEVYIRPEDVDFFKKAIFETYQEFKLQDPPESRGTGSGGGKCGEYYDQEYKWGPNYICEYWGQAIYSLQCFCLDYEDEDHKTYEDREEDTDLPDK